MSPFELPAADAPAEEWGRLATRIPGWRWPAGMHRSYPDPDDWALEGWLLRLLGGPVVVVGGDGRTTIVQVAGVHGRAANIGRAAIAAAAALGRWPGGGE